LGWNIVYENWLSIPSEITAICLLFQFWTDLNSAVFIIIFIVLTTAVGIAFIGVFGEIEFFFAMLKIFLVIGLIIFGLIVDLGGVSGVGCGFRYWKNPGPFVEFIAEGSWGKFLGFWSVMINAVFSFVGVESIAMAAAGKRRIHVARFPKRVNASLRVYQFSTSWRCLSSACS